MERVKRFDTNTLGETRPTRGFTQNIIKETGSRKII